MSKVTESIANPRVALAAAPDPVVSPAPRVNDTLGADVYDPTIPTSTVLTEYPTTADMLAPLPAESVIVTAGAL